MGGLLKATAVLSTICTLSALAFFLGLLGPVERMAQSGYFSTQSLGFLLSVGLASGFLLSVAIVKGLGRRNVPDINIEDPVSDPPDAEAV